MKLKTCLSPTPWGSCRKCENCIERRIRSWVMRMQFEAMKYDRRSVTYITFTYDDKHLPKTVYEAKESMQNFFKRLRKITGSNSIRYVCGLEKGTRGTFRYHWHCILFGLPFSLQHEVMLRREWGNGFIDWKIAEPGNMAYCMKYCIKDGLFLMSRKPGIGTHGVDLINDALRKLSTNELNKLLEDKYARKGVITKTLQSLKIGRYYYSLDRFFRERILQITLGGIYGEKPKED